MNKLVEDLFVTLVEVFRNLIVDNTLPKTQLEFLGEEGLCFLSFSLLDPVVASLVIDFEEFVFDKMSEEPPDFLDYLVCLDFLLVDEFRRRGDRISTATRARRGRNSGPGRLQRRAGSIKTYY